MEIKTYENSRKKEWDDFCLESDNAWFWHTSDWLEYTIEYDPLKSVKNLSFFVEENGTVRAICPLILEQKGDIKEFAFGGNYTPMPAFLNSLGYSERNKILKIIFEHIDQLAKENDVLVAKFKSVVLDSHFLNEEFRFNDVLRFGFFDVSIGTQILDLSISIENLKRGLRHGHKSDLTKAEKNLDFELFDQDNVNESVFEKYHQAKIERGSTRSKKTFDLMFEFIRRGNAFLIAAKHKEKIVSFSYFFVYKNNAYYGSSVNLEENEKLPVSHGIQWKAIEYMKDKKVKFYEIGWQVFSSGFNDFSSKKEVTISRFKRGFGGTTFPLFMAEKYYDKKYLEKVWSERLKNVLDSYE